MVADRRGIIASFRWRDQVIWAAAALFTVVGAAVPVAQLDTSTPTPTPTSTATRLRFADAGRPKPHARRHQLGTHTTGVAD